MLGLAGSGTAAEQLLPVDQHVAIGLRAAEQAPGYASLCDLTVRLRDVNVPRQTRSGNTPSSGRERSTERASAPEPLHPTRVFDNLYFLGNRSVAAWLYGTPAGYILIDGLRTDEEAERLIFGGMARLGLDPENIRHVLVTHAHGDHYGGADHVAGKLGIDIMMSAPDWQLAATLGNHPRFGPPPAKGTVVQDQQVLRFGTSELTVHLTPGHTPGTISPVFQVHDGDIRHVALLWGGTGFNFGADVGMFLTYARSARNMRQEALSTGVDVFLSGHPRRDGTSEMLAALTGRPKGTAHPFVKGADGYALFTVLEQCALAQASRLSKLRK